jgi:hypothetical protein
MKHVLIAMLLLISNHIVSAQNGIREASIETTGLAGTGSALPFWFSQNQNGKYSTQSNFQELTEGKFIGSALSKAKYSISYGADLTFRLTETDITAQIIQAFAGISGNILTIKIGSFADKEILGGLSSSNGNIIRSLNYRPYPMLRLSTTGFVPLLSSQSRLLARAEYDEGMLYDHRIVRHPHLHHKSLELKYLANKNLHFTVGINHYVFWGGTLANGQKLPTGLKDYFLYILGRKGSSDFLVTDQQNVAGNQLGSYKLSAEKEIQNYRVQLIVTHLFEDHSGMELVNWRDNLCTFYIGKKKTGTLLDEFLIEYMYTKNQSKKYYSNGTFEADNYFNHGVYQTGFTYDGYSMGTPLFFPLTQNAQGVVTGVENNRVSAVHAGASGHLSEQISWKALLTYSQNYGTYSVAYKTTNQRICSLAEVGWRSKKTPILVSARLAADFSNQTDNQKGLGFSVKWMVR